MVKSNHGNLEAIRLKVSNRNIVVLNVHNVMCQLYTNCISISLGKDTFHAQYQKILVGCGGADTQKGWTTCCLAFLVRILDFHCDGGHHKCWCEWAPELCTCPTSGDLTLREQEVCFSPMWNWTGTILACPALGLRCQTLCTVGPQPLPTLSHPSWLASVSHFSRVQWIHFPRTSDTLSKLCRELAPTRTILPGDLCRGHI